MSVPTRPTRRHVPIGKHFLETGKITTQQLDQALSLKEDKNCKLGQALVALGFVTEGDLLLALRSQGKFHCVNLTPGIVDHRIATVLEEEVTRRFRCLAINRIADFTTVVMEDPSDIYMIDELALLLKSKILPVFAEPARIHAVTDEIFRRGAIQMSADSGGSMIQLAVPAHTKELPHVPSLTPSSAADTGLEQALPPPEAEVPPEDLDKQVAKMLHRILEEAFDDGASDVHLEPRRADVLVRFRVEGALHERTTVPQSWAQPMIERIKVLANLDTSQQLMPQEGRAHFGYKGQRVDLRIATTPTLNGEGAVLHILESGHEFRGLEDLELSLDQLEAIAAAINCRHGFILTTGPPGSGKTTTLYGVLQRFVGSSAKIVTLEDPVENEIDGATQINTNPRAGLTYATGLRSVLRQDPDVVLVGEIRDEETAQIAVQASMTGHIVLSTLHTAGAAETVGRLADMGIERYHLAESLRMIIAQRLLRRICPACRIDHVPDARMQSLLGLKAHDTEFFIGQGCEQCHGTGYKGRTGIYEILRITPTLGALIAKSATTDEIAQCAREEGMTNLRYDALTRARSGLTTLQEVLAATSH